ncbi:Astacin-like metalloendopeptidase [Acipenser ruthenus]|uniref:Metalloendopeptidase n=1 Tax=Acipenser ruthenus TaxID=7906 RepID=A0A444UEX3_ACIRT|nr:Astacin-like metalloendopeptidase [Acipenser ruthenus]
MKSLIGVTVLGFIAQVYALPITNENSGAKDTDLEPWVVMDKIIQANANIALVTRHYSIKFGDIAVPNSRTAMFCPTNDCFWPRSDDGFVYIPYKISTEYSPSEQAVITDAMSEYAKVSCIRFVSYTNEMDYLHVQPLDGCWSYFGRSGGEQPISFSRIGCLYKGIIIHELMHTLGFYHEHNRSDREDYITIMVDNIQPEPWVVMDKIIQANANIAPSEQAVITDAMSEYAKVSCIRFVSYTNEMDYLHVQPLDGCWSYFGRSGGEQPISFSRIGCLYKGIIIHELMHTLGFYHEHNRSDREDYITIMVDNIQPDCGGLLESSSGEIFSPDYPNLYPNNKDCQWKISATSRVELIFQSLDVEYSVKCLWDYIEVHDGPSIDSRIMGPRLCGSYIPKPLTSSGKDLLIVFHSDENVASKGFHISYM